MVVLGLDEVEVAAQPVRDALEVDEVLALSVIRNRGSLHEVDAGGGANAAVFVAPLGLTLTPALRPARMAVLDEDRAALLAEVAGQRLVRA